MIELAVNHSAPGRHMLHIAALQYCAMPHVVLVLQLPFDHVGDDLHVPVGMRPETAAARNAIVVDHAQGTEAHVAGIVVVGKRETKTGVEPAVVGVAAFVSRSEDDHGCYTSQQ